LETKEAVDEKHAFSHGFPTKAIVCHLPWGFVGGMTVNWNWMNKVT